MGAVLVSGGRIISRAHNLVERRKDPTAHAEMLAIQQVALFPLSVAAPPGSLPS